MSLRTLLAPFVGLLLTACTASAPRTVHAPSANSSQWIRVFSSDNVDIVARADGWVEVIPHHQSNSYQARGGLVLPREIFSPEQVSRWVAGTNAFLEDTSRTAPRLGIWQLQMKWGARGWVVATNSDCVSGDLSIGSIDRPLGIVQAFENAAALARSLSSAPSSLRADIPRDRKDVACEARASSQFNPMPRDTGRSPHDVQHSIFRETLARFVVAPSGLVDTATLQFIPALPPLLERNARHAISQWSFTSAMLNGNVVSQWVSAPLVFTDTTHYLGAPQSDSMDRRTWIPRGDGFVEWRNPLHPNEHDVFPADAVLEWLDAFERLRTTAPTDAFSIRETVTPSGAPPKQTSAWIALMGGRGESRMGASFFWARSDSIPYLRPALSMLRCGSDTLRTIATDRTAEEQFNLARAAAQVARARNAAPTVDTTRVYGQLEIPCPVRRTGEPVAIALQDEMLRTTLQLASEALAHFIVNRDGTVQRGSLRLFGAWSATQKARIRRAVEQLTFSPARFAGQRVAQYESYLIHAGDPRATGSRATVKEVCMTAFGTTARLTVLQPSAGGKRGRMEKLAQRIAAAGRAQRSDSVPFTGTMRFVFTPENDVSFFRWTIPPANQSRAAAFIRDTPFWRFDPFTLEAVPSYGVEVELGAQCSPR